MTSTILYLLCILIGGVSGLRSLTGIAIVAIVAQRGWPHLGWLHLGGTGLGFLAKPVAMYIFVLLAIGELIADKLPVVPRAFRLVRSRRAFCSERSAAAHLQ